MSEGSDGTREFELKFNVTPEQLSRLRNKAILKSLSIAEPANSELRSVYFDTQNRDLKARGMSLRVRRIDDRWVQTLKTGRGIVAGLSNPIEIEHRVAGAAPEFDRVRKSDIPADFKDLLCDAVLEPVFETIISRTTNQIRARDGSHIEVAFDKGSVSAGTSRREIHEVEIELKSGDPAFLFDFARKLSTGETLKFSSMTKAEHGYNVVDGVTEGQPVAERYNRPMLAEHCQLDDAYQILLRACAAQISHNWRVVLDSRDVDGPHQMRVGLRRLRSTLRAFRGVVRGRELSRLEIEARDIAAVVGALRDIDVLATQIVPAVAAALPHEACLVDLQSELDRLRENTWHNVAANIAGDRTMIFLLRLGRFIEAPQWSKRHKFSKDAPAVTLASRSLDDSWQRVEVWGRRIDTLSIAERHSMRKALKRLRYQTEAFASFYPSSKTGPFIKEMKNIQNVFGYLNDVAMAEKLHELALVDGDRSTQIDRAIGIVLAWQTAHYDREWREAQRAWKSLNRTEKFWRT